MRGQNRHQYMFCTKRREKEEKEEIQNEEEDKEEETGRKKSQSQRKQQRRYEYGIDSPHLKDTPPPLPILCNDIDWNNRIASYPSWPFRKGKRILAGCQNYKQFSWPFRKEENFGRCCQT